MDYVEQHNRGGAAQVSKGYAVFTCSAPVLNVRCAMNQKFSGRGCRNCPKGYVQSDDGKACETVGWHVMNNGNFYGKLRDNKIHGKGFYQWFDGNTYYGYWANNLMDGRGIRKWKTGNTYEGQWKKNKMWGRGDFKFKSGKSYSGEF